MLFPRLVSMRVADSSSHYLNLSSLPIFCWSSSMPVWGKSVEGLQYETRGLKISPIRMHHQFNTGYTNLATISTRWNSYYVEFHPVIINARLHGVMQCFDFWDINSISLASGSYFQRVVQLKGQSFLDQRMISRTWQKGGGGPFSLSGNNPISYVGRTLHRYALKL